MDKTPDKNKWAFGSKMESMDDAALKQRIQDAYNYEMPPLRPVPYIGNPDEIVTYDYPELIGLCPVTGIADIYRVIIDFVPGEFLPELKTLKFYFMEYLKIPISHEHLCSKIYKEYSEQIKPKKLYVRLFTNVRGGVYNTVRLGDQSIETDIRVREVHG